MMTIKTELVNVPIIDLAAQYNSINEDVNEAISRVLQRNDFILGQDVGLFEQEFADYCEVDYAIGVDTGTSALELALRTFDIGPGDEVITAANTFIATAFAISYRGAVPVFVDIDPVTYTIDTNKIEKAITERTRAIIPVHLYGQPADMDPIIEIANHYGLVVVEDACQAHGARYKGRRVGGLGDAAAFSFYPAKNLGAYGDGGMIVTNDSHISATIKMLRDYGQKQKYQHVLQGYNRRLDCLQAAVLRVKLQLLEEWNEARRLHARKYDQLLAASGIVTPMIADYSESVWHLYVIRVQERDALRAYLWDEYGIGTGIHYPIPIHLQEAYQDLGYQRGDFPVTEEFADEILSLPMFPELTADKVKYVAGAIRNFTLA